MDDNPFEPYEVVGVSPCYVSFDGVTFYEVPDGMTVTEFAAQVYVSNVGGDDGPDE